MKNYLKNIILLTIVYLTAACTNTTDKKPEQSVKQEKVVESANPQFADPQMNEVYQHYIHLKTALVNDDAKEADMGAKMLEKALTNAGISYSSVPDMVKATDVKAKRQQLDKLSTQLSLIFKKYKLESGVVYKQYCPMANDGNGGSWLSSESKIENPYYGASMLTCGSVEEKIK
jgi:hypothetical protein